jgi:hypothetical protein
LSLIFAITVTSAVLLGCKTFFARSVQTETEGFFNAFVNADKNSIEIEKEELNSLYNASVRSFFGFVLKNILFAFFICVAFGIVAAVSVYKLFVKSFEDSERRFKDDFLVSISHFVEVCCYFLTRAEMLEKRLVSLTMALAVLLGPDTSVIANPA